MVLFPDDLKTLQRNYGQECSKYEQVAEKSLHKSHMLIVSGYGCALRVKNDALVVYPGKTHAMQQQQSVSLYRGVHGVNRIILAADKGLATLDALKWCQEQNIALVMLDAKGRIIQFLTPETLSDANLRRAQYAASGNGNAGKIACALVKRKIAGQLATLQKHPELPMQQRAIEILTDALKWFELPTLPDRFYELGWLRLYEGRCADAYFTAWQGLPIKWETSVKKSVPPHWLRVSGRASPLSKNHGARYAVCPVQAMLNYAYALLESQVRHVLNAQGFDLACGMLHTDLLHRDSLVYDLMECHRASVDHLVLTLVKKTTFTRGDLMTTPDGSIKFNPQLVRSLLASCRIEQAEMEASSAWLRRAVFGSVHQEPLQTVLSGKGEGTSTANATR